MTATRSTVEVDQALLAGRGITMRFGGLVALDQVDVAIAPASILGVVGPNGAGKTTLFGVLSGLLRPTAGDVFLDGTRITTSSPQARARHGLMRTFQRVQLFGELSVREHLELAHRTLHGKVSFARDLVGLGERPSAEEESRVDELLARLGLQGVEDRPAVALPLGTARLVEVGRALVGRPKVVLLDEPSSGLDTLETERLATVLSDARDDGVALVLVEHDLELVLGLSDEVTVLDFGRVIASGTPAAVRADPAVQAAYIGTESR
jgi:branched-chain amino acid transport system ATP-binding protein